MAISVWAGITEFPLPSPNGVPNGYVIETSNNQFILVPAPTGTIAGSIAATQIAYGSGANTITGTNNATLDSSGHITIAGGATFNGITGLGTQTFKVNMTGGNAIVAYETIDGGSCQFQFASMGTSLWSQGINPGYFGNNKYFVCYDQQAGFQVITVMPTTDFVGIHNSTPQTTLHIGEFGGSSAIIRLEEGVNGSSFDLGIYPDDAYAYINLTNTSAQRIWIGAGVSIPTHTITSGGDIGANTNYYLGLSGSPDVTGGYGIKDNSTLTFRYIDSSYNGIGGNGINNSSGAIPSIGMNGFVMENSQDFGSGHGLVDFIWAALAPDGGSYYSSVRLETRPAFVSTGGTKELQFGLTAIYIGGYGYQPNMFLGDTYSACTTGFTIGGGTTPVTPPTNGLYVGGGATFNMGGSADFSVTATSGAINFTANTGFINMNSKLVMNADIKLDNHNITTDTGVGTRIGTSASQKWSFWNVTPIIQPPSATAIDTLLVNTGLRATGGLANFATTIKPRTGGTAAGSAPIQFTSGSLLTSPIVGGQEFLTDKYYATITTGTARVEYTLNDIALTSGRVPFNTTNGRLTDSSALTFSAGTLTLTTLNSTSLTASKPVFTDASKNLVSGLAVAQIVASADALAQTATNASVTTYTTPNDATIHSFRVGGYVSITAISAGTLTVQISFTDENNTAQTLTYFAMGLTSSGLTTTGFTGFAPFYIRCKNNTAITFKTSFTGVSITYDVGGTIESLY